MRIIQAKVITIAFPETDASVAVCVAPPKKVTLDDKVTEVVQSGIHLLWRIPVNLDTAWVLRAWMLREIEKNMSDLKIATRWSEVFDTAIFRDNGLRMIGARKATVCPTCKGKSYKRANRGDEWGDVCVGCNNVGRIDLGRPYILLYMANREGAPMETETTRLLKDPCALIRATTIRAIQPDGTRIVAPIEINYPSEEFRLLAMQFVQHDKSDDRKSRKKTGNKKTVSKKPADAAAQAQKRSEQRDSLKEITPDNPAFTAISEYITNEFNGAPVPSHIKKSASGDVYVINTKCNFCANKGGEHAHSTVYFVMRPSGCVQRCFCMKDAIQPNGLVSCPRYVGKPRRVPSGVLEIIFSKVVLRVLHKTEIRAKLATDTMSVRTVPIKPISMHTKQYEYKTARIRVSPYCTTTSFLNAVKNANYRIL